MRIIFRPDHDLMDPGYQKDFKKAAEAVQYITETFGEQFIRFSKDPIGDGFTIFYRVSEFQTVTTN